VKIYVAAMEALRKKRKKQDETQFTTTKIGGKDNCAKKGYMMKISQCPMGPSCWEF
jgi:hypothetical protein